MNQAAPLEPVGWPRRRWFYAVALVFLGQVGLIFFLEERAGHTHPPPPFHTRINLAVDSRSEERLAQLPALSDPTLFALPNLNGFSGAAWLTFTPPEHQFTDWTPSERWLPLDTASLGKTFLEFVNTNSTGPLRIADEPLPRIPSPDPFLTEGPLTARSKIRVEGDLARRRLLNSPLLPSWAHSDILTNTVVQLLVDADGDTLSSTPLRSSGLSEADQFAWKLAASARFESLRKPGGPAGRSLEPTWGQMVFQWHTIAQADTNNTSAPP